MKIYEVSTFRDIDIRFFYKQKYFRRLSKIVNTNVASCCSWFFVSQIATMPLRSFKSRHLYGTTTWFLLSSMTALPFVKICVALLKTSNLFSKQIAALPGSWTILVEDNFICLLKVTNYLALYVQISYGGPVTYILIL